MKKSVNNEALSYFKIGISLFKEGEYEKALKSFVKADSINKYIEGLAAYILISKFWASEFDIEHEFQTLFDSFSNEIKHTPKIIELYETRAWLCYHILNNVENLDESQYLFYKTQSESDFTVCISTNPNNKYYVSRSWLFRFSKEFSKALQDINKAIELDPENSSFYKDRADIHISLGKLKDSFKDIETAISFCQEEKKLREYKTLKESLIIPIKESSFNKEIKSHFESITNTTYIEIGQIIMTYQRDPTLNRDVTAYQVMKIDHDNISVEQMAINGVPLKLEQRVVTTFKLDFFINNRSSLLLDETNDREDWPRSLQDAIKQLLEIYNGSELIRISQMSWSKFQNEYFTYCGLDQWVRNNFGLWRGNYDLLLDSKIDKIDPDNASISILYHFWEYVADNIKPICNART